jgi:hypothetical protein
MCLEQMPRPHARDDFFNHEIREVNHYDRLVKLIGAPGLRMCPYPPSDALQCPTPHRGRLDTCLTLEHRDDGLLQHTQAWSPCSHTNQL